MKFPLTIKQENSIIYILLNSQGTSVNVLTRKAAEQLNEFFDQLKPNDASLIVFQSKKPYSFLNGAELIITSVVKDLSDVDYFTAQTRSAYEKVFLSPIPTVAAIQGNCYGCGVEFALCCDYRIVSNSYDTHFYLTEIKDYLILPFYGAIEKLPHIVGIKAAIDLIIFGETWHANEAARKGLVDQIFPAKNFDQEMYTFLQHLLTIQPRKQTLRSLERTQTTKKKLRLSKESEMDIRKKIYTLPPSQHSIHLKCLDLLIKAANTDTFSVKNTIKNTFNTVISKASRNATSFFFIRSMATVASIGASSRIPDRDVKIILSHQKNNPFCEMLYKRQINGLVLLENKITDIKHNSTQNTFFHLILNNNQQIPIEVVWEYAKVIKTSNSPVFYFSAPHIYDICEVHISQSMQHDIKAFLILLCHVGYLPIVTHIDDSPVNILLHTYMKFVENILNAGTIINELNYSLWSFGFERSPSAIAKIVYNRSLYNESLTNGKYNKSLVMDLLYDLFNQTIMILDNKWLKHTSQIDVLMRYLFGFPLEKGSFYSFMIKHKNKIIH